MRPFQLPQQQTFPEMLLLDADVMHVVPEYRDYLQSRCHCNPMDYIELMEYLADQQGAVWLISQDRMELIQNYCRLVRSKDYGFEWMGDFEHDHRTLQLLRFPIRKAL